MSLENAEKLCVIGAGLHAFFQVKSILTVRNIQEISICNRTLSNAQLLKDKLELELKDKKVKITIHNLSKVENQIKQADIVLCATSSNTPILKSEWLKENAYVASIGPKFYQNHELPTDILANASIAISDAPEQISAYPKKYFLDNIEEIVSLEDALDLKLPNKKGYRLFLSTGRSGTEVIVADFMNEYLKTSNLDNLKV